MRTLLESNSGDFGSERDHSPGSVNGKSVKTQRLNLCLHLSLEEKDNPQFNDTNGQTLVERKAGGFRKRNAAEEANPIP